MKKLLLTLLTFLIAVNVAYPQLAIRHRLATPRPAGLARYRLLLPQKGASGGHHGLRYQYGSLGLRPLYP